MDFLGLIIYLLICCIWGAICREFAKNKGYSETAWFWLGFFFNILALLVICVIKAQYSPAYINNVNALREYKKLLDSGVITPEEFEKKKEELLKTDPPLSYNTGNDSKTWVCPECGSVNAADLLVCKNCRRER